MNQTTINTISGGEDTIAAVSTPPGRGGIAVIRISGPRAISCAEGFFRAHSGRSLTEAPPRTAVYGSIGSFPADAPADILDDGLVTVFPGPRSYTGEDVAEISCHGGIALTGEVLSLALRNGARPAQPGEFTKRAFINGKLSLTEAEAVIGLIDAESSRAIRLASAQSRGILKEKINGFYEELRTLVASLYAYIDYPDEDMTEVPGNELTARLSALRDGLSALCGTYRLGHAVFEGIPTAIIGKPNAGKSSLLNALLGHERAIVTDIPGTTRDTVEETLELDGVLLRLCDTAGLRTPGDEAERLGTLRTGEKALQAELLFCLFDLSRPLDTDDERVLTLLGQATANGANAMLVLNKCDLPPAFNPVELTARFPDLPVIRLSAKQPDTLLPLKNAVTELFRVGTLQSTVDAAVLTGARQHAAVQQALTHVQRALAAREEGFTADIAGLDLEAALAALGETDGRTVTMDVVSGIFSRFCVGK